jgi:hypothetical protein
MLREALDLFDALASVGYGPLVLTIDDLHWADRATLDLITAVGRRRQRPASLLVLGTYRHTDLDEGNPLSAAVSELVVRGLATHIRLEPFSFETATELITRREAVTETAEVMGCSVGAVKLTLHGPRSRDTAQDSLG